MAWNAPFGWNAPAWGEVPAWGGGGKGNFGWNSGRGRGKGAKGPPARQLFVDGLLPECEDRDIREYFATFGSIKEAFVPLEKDTTISRCYASLRFFDDGVAEKVLAGKHEIWGHEITLSEEAPNAEERPEFHGPGTSEEPEPPFSGDAELFYAMGLTEATGDKVLRDYFGGFGEVTECRVLGLEADGTRPASIRMAEPSAAGQIVRKLVHDILGTQVRVGRNLEHVPEPKGAGKKGAPISTQEPQVEPGKYVLADLAGDVDEQDIWDYFGVLGTIREVTIQQNEQTATVAFDEFDDEIKKFMLEQTHELKGKAATVREFGERKGKGEFEKGGKAFKGGWGCGGKDGGQSGDGGWGKGGWGKDGFGGGQAFGSKGGGFDKGCGKEAWVDPVLAVAKGGSQWTPAPDGQTLAWSSDGCGKMGGCMRPGGGKRGYGDGAAGAEPAAKFQKGEYGKKGKSFESAMGFGFEAAASGGAPKGAYAAPGWSDGGGWGGAKGCGKGPAKGWGGAVWS